MPDPAVELLQRGAIGRIELIPWGSNYTFAAEVSGDDGAACLAVYKPRRGEVPLRDFPNGTLYKREVAAYELACLLQWDIVPPTFVRSDGPHGIGSLQLYVQPETSPAAAYDSLRQRQRSQLQRMALFDLLVNNADRKAGHCLLDQQGHVWGIDHGLTFHHVPKLRTVIWDFCDEPFPPDLLQRMIGARRDGELCQEIRGTLSHHLADIEIEALFLRWDRLIANPCYPRLDSYRNVPWPPF